MSHTPRPWALWNKADEMTKEWTVYYAAIQIMAGLGDHGFLSPYEAAQIALMRARELFDQLDKDQ